MVSEMNESFAGSPALTACPDCGVAPGTPHESGCDVARCVLTGHQALACSAFADEGTTLPGGITIAASHPGRDCGGDTWTGEWPGNAECAEFGWWTVFHPAPPGEQYGRREQVPAGTPGAVADLNRLGGAETYWDREARRYRLSWLGELTQRYGQPAAHHRGTAYGGQVLRESWAWAGFGGVLIDHEAGSPGSGIPGGDEWVIKVSAHARHVQVEHMGSHPGRDLIRQAVALAGLYDDPAAEG